MRRLGLLLLALLLAGCASPPPAAPSDAPSAAPSAAPGDSPNAAPRATLLARAGEETSDDAIDAALARAGPNRGEIERYLARYETGADEEQRRASRWLVANMPGHGFARMALRRADGSIVAFSATDHANVAAAQAALDELTRREGPLEFGVELFVEDLRVLTADALIDNQERAFASWRSAPWSEAISFPTFLEHILPYRGSSEAIDLTWRVEAGERLAPALNALRADLGREPTLAEATRAALKAAKKWVKFRQLYYLHPTDQSWGEMMASRAGRCEDQSNAAVFAARSIATVVAGDLTPFWADRDNNHAWDVALDSDGQGSAKLAHRPAKVYRRMFGVQPSSLGAMRRPGEPVPGPLAAPNLQDVTGQYVDIADVTVAVGTPPPGSRFAYLCVFNAGAWRPVDHALVEDGIAHFRDMGRHVLYLPAWHTPDGMMGAAAPFILATDGRCVPLASSATLERVTLDADAIPAEAEVDVCVWSCASHRWTRLVRLTRPADGASIALDLPIGGLVWLHDPAGRRLERPFTIEGGTRRTW